MAADAQHARDDIRIGVAGWDYPDWNGVVYPTRSERLFDRLAFISEFVDLVEINNTFYRPVAASTAESWVRRTSCRPGFTFTAKSHRSWTHERGADLDQVVGETLRGLAPLREANRLAALLVQFPQSFLFNRESLDHVDRLAERAEGWPLALEVRHASWESGEAEAWLTERALSWCLVDQPRVGGSTAGALPRVTGPLAYLRLHGRNAENWFRPDAGRDARYDYLYSRPQLAELAGQARQMADRVEQTFVVQNNHFRGKALVNALQLKSILHRLRPRAPEELVMAYPDLEPDVEVRRSRLF